MSWIVTCNESESRYIKCVFCIILSGYEEETQTPLNIVLSCSGGVINGAIHCYECFPKVSLPPSMYLPKYIPKRALMLPQWSILM